MGNCVVKTRRFSLNKVDDQQMVSSYTGLVGYNNENEAVAALRMLQERLEAEDPECCSDGSLIEVLVDLLSDTSPALQTEALRTIQLVLEHEPEETLRGPTFIDCGLLPRILALINGSSSQPGVIIAGFACAEAVLVESRGSALVKTIESGLIEAALKIANHTAPDSDITQERLSALEFLLAAAQRVPKTLKSYFSADDFVNNVAYLLKDALGETEVTKVAKKILRALEKKGILSFEKLMVVLSASRDCALSGSTETLNQINGLDFESKTGKVNVFKLNVGFTEAEKVENSDNKFSSESDYENA